MDQVCTTLVIASIAVLFFMWIFEMQHMRRRQVAKAHTETLPNTCGMKTEIENSTETSAKKSFMENKMLKESGNKMTSSEEWLNENVECTHKELEQDEKAQAEYFMQSGTTKTWTADEKASEEWNKKKIDTEKAKVLVNTRAIGLDAQSRQPGNSKNIGVGGVYDTFMRAQNKALGNSENVKFNFSESCGEFHLSDSYVAAKTAARA